ncbi:MAG: hypothetical protein WCI52_01095 [bacterium]
MKKQKIITICSSASFFKEALEIEEKLRKMGFKVKLPYTATKMKKSGDFRVETYKTWFKNPNVYSRKTWLVKNHIRKVIDCDAVLITNYKKKGIPGYIGGNTLIEMTIAFHYKKPIYILNPISKKLMYEEEIYALQPVFLNGDLSLIS